MEPGDVSDNILVEKLMKTLAPELLETLNGPQHAVGPKWLSRMSITQMIEVLKFKNYREGRGVKRRKIADANNLKNNEHK